MKIGFISRYFPMPPEKCVHGVFRRMGAFIKAMGDACELEMLFFVNRSVDGDARFKARMERELQRHWEVNLRLELCRAESPALPENLWAHYIRPALDIRHCEPFSFVSGERQREGFHRLLSRNPDILFVHRLESMAPVLHSKEPHPPVYLDLDDIEHIAFSRGIRQPPWWPGKRLYFLRVPALALWEYRAIRRTQATFVCSEEDQRYLERVWKHRNIRVIPNSMEIHPEEELTEAPTVLFLGTYPYAPNAAAADFLIREVWPRIFSARPDARLIIAGAGPENIPSYKEAPPGVEFRGFVEDLPRLYKEVRAVCCPIFAGGGTRIKILEAAAFGKPVVSTALGAEGLTLTHGREILIGKDAASLAESCTLLLEDTQRAKRIGSAARSAVSSRYDRAHVIRAIRRELGIIDAEDRTGETPSAWNDPSQIAQRLPLYGTLTGPS